MPEKFYGGDIFKLADDYRIYMIMQTDAAGCKLVSLNDGNRWTDSYLSCGIFPYGRGCTLGEIETYAGCSVEYLGKIKDALKPGAAEQLELPFYDSPGEIL